MDTAGLVLKCLRCGHEWLRRSLIKLPAHCPGCNSPYWNTPKRPASKTPTAQYQRARRSDDPTLAAKALKRIRAARRKAKKKAD